MDNCSYNRPYDDQSQIRVALEAQAKLHIQELVKAGKLELIGSYTLDYEISRNPYEMKRQSISLFIKNNMKGYVGAERDDAVSPIAADIMKTGVKEKDAYHVACAIYAGCDYFISTDARLLKYQTEKIKIVTPIEFIAETEGKMMPNTVEIMNRGMECLTQALGDVGAGQFISIIIREKFDYTKWQRQYFDAMQPGEFHEKALEFAKAHPYTGNAERL